MILFDNQQDFQRSLPRREGKKLVLLTGYFDLFHAGHALFLEKCKQNSNEVLVVGVNSNDLAKKVKGSDRPYMDVHDRIEIVRNHRSVDFVFGATSFYSEENGRLLRIIDPDIVVFSQEANMKANKTHIMKFVEEFSRANQNRPEIRWIPIQRPDLSTTHYALMISQKNNSVLEEDKSRWHSAIHLQLKNYAQDCACEDDTPTTAAFIVHKSEIVSRGCNTRPKVFSHDHDDVIHDVIDTDEFRRKRPRPVHAEINALIDFFNSKSDLDLRECELYCLKAPCSACAETYAKHSIGKVYYFHEFVNNMGLIALKNNGIPFEKLYCDCRLTHDRPKVFIASSTEGIAIASTITTLLGETIERKEWFHRQFVPGSNIFEVLEKMSSLCQFAIIVWTPDIPVTGQKRWLPKENVVFECGFFVGKLGRERVFIVHPSKIDIPTDLHGIITCPYNENEKNLATALKPACEEIREKIKKLCKDNILKRF